MTDHDPLCNWAGQPKKPTPVLGCECDRIARVRADADARWHAEMIEWRKEVEAVLRERIAQEILDRCNDTPNGPCGRCARAAYIARGGAR